MMIILMLKMKEFQLVNLWILKENKLGDKFIESVINKIYKILYKKNN